ncbi:MAG TPA: hemerythrin domain-containing protein [Usitatibacter sp.]|nr:hemerythrin domain-containing protein [Usitatibacter sp.]
MAKARNGSGARPVAIELLESDHRHVEALLDQYESEKEGDDGTKRAIAMQICAELTAHAQLEEELFYPWLRENLDEEQMEMLEEAYVEHASAKDLIAQIEGASDIGPEYDAKVKVLGEYVKHHVQEEENEIFKEVRDMQDELDELGQEMHARKAELMEELGLMQEEEEGEEEEGMAAGASRGRARSRQGEQRGAR